MYMYIYTCIYIDRYSICDNLYAGVPLRVATKRSIFEEGSLIDVDIGSDRY